MSKTVYDIRQTADDGSSSVYVPESFFSTVKECTSIAFGLAALPCAIKSSKHLSHEVEVPAALFRELGIPAEGPLHLIEHDNTLHLGPLVGIFTAGFTGQDLRPAGERSFVFARLLTAAGTVHAHAFIFGKHHIDWEHETIQGFFYTQDGWEQKTVPFPHVIYDRLPNRRTESLEEFQQLRRRLQLDYLIPWYNPGFFDKWTIHEIFGKYPKSAVMIPTAVKNPSAGEIQELLDRCGQIYIKPINGSLGNGVVQLIKDQEGTSYYARLRSGGENRLRRYPSLGQLLQNIYPTESFEGLMVQQGIVLKRTHGQKYDFRVHTNKNENGEWQVTGIAAKLAGPGSLTTHLSSGGKVFTLEELYNDLAERRKIEKTISDAVLLLSTILDRHLKGNLGEVGFDIGIDKENRLWVFEANSKPGRSIFYHPGLKESEILTRKLPISYGLYLAEKNIRSRSRLKT
ncbi:YheC/YheD family protein [Bacillus marinisedimentorum]|uniref:YheC/YheD family endospore coat-associated protein n=1 Tax=Bacillus marinisedimentorum TaxID=1821260 RepID=UPI0007E1F0E4|nr:YheC/YheD family protein [Bacillus marinisedimentorum]